MVAIAIVVEIQTFFFFFESIIFLKFECFYCRMAHLQKKLQHQTKVTIDNQHQVNVATNEEEIEMEQKIIIYTPALEGKP